LSFCVLCHDTPTAVFGKVFAYHLNNLGELGPVSDRARWWHGQETGHSPEILRSYVMGNEK
ncbi:MAG: hypothetical protein ACE5FD_14430, partial [Anaerolineae bacterium]